MFKPEHIRLLAEMNQKECSVGIRIAAKLLEEGKSLTERSLKGVLKINDLRWEEVKTTLQAVLVFKGGRVDFLTPENRADPWDVMTPEDRERIDKQIQKVAKKQNIVLTEIEARIHALGGLTPAEARSLFYRMKHNYGQDGVAAALDRIGAKRPNDPKAYLHSVLKTMAAEGAKAGMGAAGAGRPQRTRAFIKPAGTGMGKTEFIGWEAAPALDAAGNPIWTTGRRRKMFRLGPGNVTFVEVDLADHIPTIMEDPGWIAT